MFGWVTKIKKGLSKSTLRCFETSLTSTILSTTNVNVNIILTPIEGREGRLAGRSGAEQGA